MHFMQVTTSDFVRPLQIVALYSPAASINVSACSSWAWCSLTVLYSHHAHNLSLLENITTEPHAHNISAPAAAPLLYAGEYNHWATRAQYLISCACGSVVVFSSKAVACLCVYTSIRVHFAMMRKSSKWLKDIETKLGCKEGKQNTCVNIEVSLLAWRLLCTALMYSDCIWM